MFVFADLSDSLILLPVPGNKKKGSQPTVTCNPLHVNKMLQQGDLHNGLVIVAAVESVEEKGRVYLVHFNHV